MGQITVAKAYSAKLTGIALVLVLTIWSVPGAYASGPSYRLEVAGLACPFCAYGIEKKLSRLDGVETVATHIKEGAVIVTMSEGARLDETTADTAVEDAGFTLNTFEEIRKGAGK